VPVAILIVLLGLVSWAGRSTTGEAAGAIAGEATLVDNVASLDRVVVKATGLKPAGLGQVYRVWLVADDGSVGRYLGDVIPDATGAVAFTWDQPAGENLLASHDFAGIWHRRSQTDRHGITRRQGRYRGGFAGATLA
jgi:hypothetical protein